jgi:hypothetical protein
LPVAYNISVIDTPVIYVGSGAAAASNVTETLIITAIHSTITAWKPVEYTVCKSCRFLHFLRCVDLGFLFIIIHPPSMLAIHTLVPINACLMYSFPPPCE